MLTSPGPEAKGLEDQERHRVRKFKPYLMKLSNVPVTLHAGVIAGIWYVETDHILPTEKYYMFPDNHAEVILSLRGDCHRKIIGSSGCMLIRQGEAVLTRTRGRGMVLNGEGGLSFLLIKLHPAYVKLFRKNRSELPATHVFPLELPVLFESGWKRAIKSGQVETLVRIFEAYVDTLIRETAVDELIMETVSLIRMKKGGILIKDIYQILGVCKSTLEQKFFREVGISPKEFCKVEKMNYFLKSYNERGDNATLTQLTFRSGYYDQSHLIKDFRYFMDTSPRKFMREVNHLPINR